MEEERGLDQVTEATRTSWFQHVGQAFAGVLSAGGPVVDVDFGIKASAVRLSRHVEMYLWKEEAQTDSRARLGGGEERTTTHKYVRAWSDKPVDSTRFKDPRGHTNPFMTYQGHEAISPGTRLGSFAVPDGMLRGFGGPRPLPATDAQASAPQIRVNKPVTVLDGILYVGRDPGQPAVGDMKISFFQVPHQPASVVAAQAGAGFASFTTHEGTLWT